MAMRTGTGRRPKAVKSPRPAHRSSATRKAAVQSLADGVPAAKPRGKAAYEARRASSKERPDLYPFTISGIPIKPLYTAEDLAGLDLDKDLGFPGEYPYTRGIHTTMYRGRMFTMRQFAGFGTPRESNQRYHYLLEHGQTGLSVAFDNPTIMGYDSDSPKAHGEVGKCGVAVDSLRDMEILLDGIDPGEISTSMTINGPAATLWAFYLANAEKRGVSFDRLRGTLQNDILKEYIAQKCWCFPPRPSLRIIVDLIEFSTKHVPQWNTISISGYHIREAGSTAAQELAFTLADGFTYVEACLERGLDIDAFAPRLSYFWNSHLDFFEEIAKLRAARRIWARHMRERYGAKKRESWLMRFHTQTAGCSLWDKQPENNIVRTAYEALAAVLGGTQSLHTNSMDETIALPSDKAVKIALRTQQIIAHELGVTETIDPLAGSYYVEVMTKRIEDAVFAEIEKIDRMGGALAAIRTGYFQRELAREQCERNRALDTGKRKLVGMNDVERRSDEESLEIFRVDPESERRQIERLRAVKARRDEAKVAEALERVREAAEGDENLVPPILEAVKLYASQGEICDVLREAFGTYMPDSLTTGV